MLSPQSAASPAPSIPVRARLLFVLAALGIWAFLAHENWPVAPSERFHFLVPLIYAADWLLFARHKLSRTRQIVTLVATAMITMGVLLAFYMIAADYARELQSHVTWVEPVSKAWLCASLAALFAFWNRAFIGLLRLVPRLKMGFDGPRGWLGKFAAGCFVLLLFWPDAFTAANAHRFKYASNLNPRQSLGLDYQNVQFAAEDGEHLDGWFIPQRGSRKTVVVVHGIGVNKGVFLGIVPFLHRAGWNVLLFDLRAHGDSGGHTTSFSFDEARDVRGAVRYLATRPDSPIVALYGFSLGGASVIQAFNTPGAMPSVRAVVVDSAFAEFEPLARAQTHFLPSPFDTIIFAMIEFWSKLEIGVGLNQIAPYRSIQNIAPRRLLMIHGTDDGFVPPENARINFRAARPFKQLWLVKGGQHVQNRTLNPPVYEKRVAAFLNEAAP